MRRYDIADHVSHSAVCVKTAKHIVETPSPPGSFLTLNAITKFRFG